VTERERVIRLNGIGGVTFKTRIEFSIRVFSLRTFIIRSEAKLQRSPERFRDEARLSISDPFCHGAGMNSQKCLTNLKIHAHH
jgi:hypothetical protein